MPKKTQVKMVPEQRIQRINPDGTVGETGEIFQPLATQFTVFFDGQKNPEFFFYKDQGVTWRFPK